VVAVPVPPSRAAASDLPGGDTALQREVAGGDVAGPERNGTWPAPR